MAIADEITKVIRERIQNFDGTATESAMVSVGTVISVADGIARVYGLEGVMAKKLDSQYEPGKRSGSWLKVKNRNRQELVIGGWLEGEGKRRGLPGALLVGYYDKGKFVYAGKVGTGFTDAMLEKLKAMMEPLETAKDPFDLGAPPKKATYVKPKIVAEFEFVEWTRSGQLRAPSFKGLRLDKPAREVVREGG